MKKIFCGLTLFILLGLFLRIGYFSDIKRIPFFESPVADSKIYFDRALEICEGKLFPRDVSFHSSPIYPYFIALTYMAANKSLAGPRFFQMLFGILNILVVFFILRYLFDKRIALIAAFFMSVYPVFIYFEGDLMMIPLVLFTFNLSLLMFVLYQFKRRKRFIAMGGIFLGISAMGKPDLIMLAPFIGLWILFFDGNFKQRLGRFLLLTVAVIVSIFPLTIANYLSSDEFTLLTSNGGINFYIGNHEGADGMFHLPSESGLWDHRLYLSSKEIAETQSGGELTPGQVSRYWFHRSLTFIAEKPISFIKILVRKTLLMFNKFEVSNHHSYYFFCKHSKILNYNPFSLSFFVFFGCVGLVLSLSQWRKYLLLYIYLGVTFAMTVLFFITSRYRLPSVSIYIMFASFGITGLWYCARSKQYRKILFSVVPAGVLFLLSLLSLTEFGTSFNQEYNNLGGVYMDSGEYDKAIFCYKKVLDNNPHTMFGHYNLGNVYLQQGKKEMALSEYLQEIENNPEFHDSYFNIAKVYMQKGNIKKAGEYLEKLLNKKISKKTLINLAYVYFELENFEKATQIYERLNTMYPDDLIVKEGLVLCYKKTNRENKIGRLREEIISLKNQKISNRRK